MPKPDDTVRFEKFAGLRNNVDPERFGPEDLVTADNVDLDATGRVSRRVGRTKYSATATHSLWSDRDIALCVQGTTLYRVNTDYSLTAIKTGLTAGRRMVYTRINDLVYMTNGVESFVLDHGRMRSWGLPVPPYPAITLGTGQLPAGTYQLTTTYQRNDGQESGARLAARLDVHVNGALTLGFTAPGDPDVVQHNVYLSPPNGDALYLALEVPVANASVTYAGDTSEFAYPLKTQFLSAPPPGHRVANMGGWLFVAVGDVIYPSTPLAYELFDLRDYIPADSAVGLIVAMEEATGGLFIGTEQTTGVLAGADPATFQYVAKTDYGVVPGALAMVDGSVFEDGGLAGKQLPMWLSTQGVCIGLPGMEIRNLTRKRYNVSVGRTGAAVFMPGLNRFVAVSGT